GVRIRSRAAARAIENRRRADARLLGVDITGTQCAATAKTGERCRRDAISGTDTCHIHDETRTVARDAAHQRIQRWQRERRRYSDYADAVDQWATAYPGRHWLEAA